MQDWIPIANLLLNLLLFPLLKIIYDLKINVAQLVVQMQEQEKRLNRIQTTCDSRH